MVWSVRVRYAHVHVFLRLALDFRVQYTHVHVLLCLVLVFRVQYAHVHVLLCLVLVFKFSEVNFKTFLDIPSVLLKSVAQCFREKMSVCRKCFYGERNLSKKSSSQSGGMELCSTGEHKWLKPIIVIPGMCLRYQSLG